MNALNGKEVCGRALKVAWSKQSKKFDPENDARPPNSG